MNQLKLIHCITDPDDIIAVTESDPVPCWGDNLNGLMGLTIAGALAINHVMNFKGSHELNVIPVDICAKGMIIASYKIWKDNMKVNQPEIPIYNAASIKFVTYESMTACLDFTRKNPSKKIMGIPHVTFTSCLFYAWILRIFRHFIPALFLDGLLIASGNKPRLFHEQH